MASRDAIKSAGSRGPEQERPGGFTAGGRRPSKVLLEDQGATFANFFISYPLCCPSRASIYDLRHDPHQLTNVVDEADPGLVKDLAARLQELKECAGVDCRNLEDAPILEDKLRLLAAQRQ